MRRAAARAATGAATGAAHPLAVHPKEGGRVDPIEGRAEGWSFFEGWPKNLLVKFTTYLDDRSFVRFMYLGKSHKQWVKATLRAGEVEHREVQGQADAEVEQEEIEQQRRKDLLRRAAEYYIEHNLNAKTNKIRKSRVFGRFRLLHADFTREDLDEEIDNVLCGSRGETSSDDDDDGAFPGKGWVPVTQPPRRPGTWCS